MVTGCAISSLRELPRVRGVAAAAVLGPAGARGCSGILSTTTTTRAAPSSLPSTGTAIWSQAAAPLFFTRAELSGGGSRVLSREARLRRGTSRRLRLRLSHLRLLPLASASTSCAPRRPLIARRVAAVHAFEGGDVVPVPLRRRRSDWRPCLGTHRALRPSRRALDCAARSLPTPSCATRAASRFEHRFGRLATSCLRLLLLLAVRGRALTNRSAPS